jgi:hypothetical protein
MKTIKLQLSAEKLLILNNMLQTMFSLGVVKVPHLRLEYYVLIGMYKRLAERFLIATDRPLKLTIAEACALHRVMCRSKWPITNSGAVATEIIWRLSPMFPEEKAVDCLQW